MKNYTENGTHFDASTARDLRVVNLRCVVSPEVILPIGLVIPKTIWARMSSEDIAMMQERMLPLWYGQHFIQAVEGGVYDVDLIHQKIAGILAVRAAEHFYNLFISIQARDGNEAWEVPSCMVPTSREPDNAEFEALKGMKQ